MLGVRCFPGPFRVRSRSGTKGPAEVPAGVSPGACVQPLHPPPTAVHAGRGFWPRGTSHIRRTVWGDTGDGSGLHKALFKRLLVHTRAA